MRPRREVRPPQHHRGPARLTGHRFESFGTATADLVEERFVGAQLSYRAVTTDHPLADAVPREVLDTAVDPKQRPKAKPAG